MKSAGKRWTDDEHRILKENYRNMLAKECAALVGRSVAAVKCRAKLFKISRPHRSDRYHWKWRGRRFVDVRGYVLVYCPEHPHPSVNKSVLEHRLVMEKTLGRYLEKDEHVHHIDGNRQNNDPSNLMLLTHSEHSKICGSRYLEYLKHDDVTGQFRAR